MHGNTEKEKLFVLRVRGAEGAGSWPHRIDACCFPVLSLFYPLTTKISVDCLFYSSLASGIGLERGFSN